MEEVAKDKNDWSYSEFIKGVAMADYQLNTIPRDFVQTFIALHELKQTNKELEEFVSNLEHLNSIKDG